MKKIHDDDWETSGQRDYEVILDNCDTERSILEIRDRLTALADLVDTCSTILAFTSLESQRVSVASILSHYVLEDIRSIEKDLGGL